MNNTETNKSPEAAPKLGLATGSTVPFSEADIDRTPNATLVEGKAIALTGNRTVEVWKVKDHAGALCIRIMRPTKDDKTSKLVFGVSEDAAFALLTLLGDHLSNDKSS